MSKHIEHIADAAIKTKKHFKNSTFIGGLLPTLLATVILFIATMIAHGPEHLPSWFNWIMLIIFCVSITYSLVISQKRHLVGEYGETILILIPTFVWLMGGTFKAQEILLYISLALVIVGSLFYAFAWVAHSKNNEEVGKIRVQLVLRLAFVAVTVAATVILSLILLNWAYGSMHFQRIIKEDEHTHVVETLNDSEDGYKSTPWVMFIAVVTILSAVLLVMIGLTRTTTEDAKIVKLKNSLSHLFKKKHVDKTVIFEVNHAKLERLERKEFKAEMKQQKKHQEDDKNNERK